MTSDHDAIEELSAVSNVNAVHRVQHYLYFPLEQVARKVAAVLRERGFAVDVGPGGWEENWLVLAKSEMVPTESAIAALRTFFQEIAAGNGGEYDGWEAEVQGKKDQAP